MPPVRDPDLFDRILLALDGSPLAEAILPQVRRVLKLRDSEILVVRAYSPPLPAGDFAYPPMIDAAEREAREYVEGIVRRLADQGARARAVVRQGAAADVILETAEREGASLIAMSTHGRTGLARWIFGSVAEKVLRASPVPVLLVRSFERGAGGRPRPRAAEEIFIGRVLVPLDGSEFSLRALPHAASLAELFEADVLLLHVTGPEETPRPRAESVLERAAAQLATRGLGVDIRVRRGDPASEILEACRAERADAVAMATHGRSGLSRWTLGSVTEKVLRGAEVPLLVTPPPASAAAARAAS
ncbi:MAG TPA: universal stress protein [Planctomycetota bacterium]|nr:universal stress protein [Planctomycetota bacterium]